MVPRPCVGLLPATRTFTASLLQSAYICPALRSSSVTPSYLPYPKPGLPRHHNFTTTRANYNNGAPKDGSVNPEKTVLKSNEAKPPLSARVWTKVKQEASHYWHGTKLLSQEVRISTRLQIKLLRGKTLTRRERRQLKRTTQDLLRLIPFSFFVIVPFMELLLPVALKVFPQMLPSTFVDEYKEEEKKRKLLKVRVEMAKFLQETIRESGIARNKAITDSEEFKVFFRKLRNTGESPSTDDIVRVARLFENDLTLDNLSRPQLVGMCRYMNINAFGTDNFLRYNLRSRLRKLKDDDRLIDYEGVASLNDAELIHAAASRGIRTSNTGTDKIRRELKQWIELHLHRDLSGSLLILSKAFAFTKKEEGEDDQLDSLKDTLSTLPDSLVNETELEVSSEVSNKQRLDVLQEQEELIEDEAEQEAEEEEARKADKEAKEADKAAKVTSKTETPETEVSAPDAAERVKEPYEQVASSISELESGDDVRLTTEQLGELGQALAIVSDKSSVLRERKDLSRLMEQNSAMAESQDNRLAKKIRTMIQKIDEQLKEYDEEVGSKMNIVNVGEGGKIAVRDLKKALSVIKHRPSDEATDVLLQKLDVDHDNWVPLDHIVSLIEGEGLGTIVDDQASQLMDEGAQIRGNKEPSRPRKEDIVADS